MAEEIINNGQNPGDFNGEGLYYAFGKIKRMFTELYSKFVTTDASVLSHTSSISALQAGQTSQAGQITALQGQFSDGAVTFRHRVVLGVLYLDKTLTATGFSGTEDVDWTNLNAYV